MDRDVERRATYLLLKINITTCCKEKLHDSIIAVVRCEIQGCRPLFSLSINVAARSKELLCDGLMPMFGRKVERRGQPILHLKIDVTASSKELLRDGRMPCIDRHV